MHSIWASSAALALCPEASQTIGFQVGLKKLLWRPGQAQNCFCSKIATANCAFHSGGPASCGPITGEEQASDARPLYWTPTIDSWLRGKCGGSFLDDGSFEKVRIASGRKRVADFLANGPFPHYQPHPDRPGLLVRIDADGTRKTGRFIKRQFVPSDAPNRRR